MAKAEIKTKKTKDSVPAFLAQLDDEEARRDCKTLVGLMEVDWFQMGFSPRKAALTLYLLGGLHKHAELLKKLGKHKTGKGCLYIRRLSDVDGAVLKKLIRTSAAEARKEAGA